ncbi:saccharopine dehydrogenase family protein [Nocardioides bigeumensis]|uniref:Saccharopine dehydrogenase NADP-binding domain-containing protein n=1 Tax=Nocardioides bigeumensis TaxID=433657 RepID=A0ABP5KCS5_9ACTN
MPHPDADLDVVLLGATGFTGALTADYLAAHGPADLRWALAGRSAAKLEAVRARLAADHPERPGLADLELLTADVEDPSSLEVLAKRARVVITTVGPYLKYGEHLVAACAGAGTDYVDLTGEAEFVDRMWTAHHATAVASGARIVHACGFDSVPHDLGAYFTVQQLSDDEPIALRGVVRSNGQPSGGTFQTALEGMARVREAGAARAARRKVEPRPEGRRSRSVPAKPRRDPVLGYYLLPLPTIDPLIVARSGAALATYGPDFRYSHYAGTKTLAYAVGGAATIGALGLAAQVKPLRELLMRRLPAGTGPDEDRRERSWFKVDFVAEQGDTTLHTRVRGGDPGYGETAKMLAESALCLAFDDNPPTAGQVTTAQAMGDKLLARLQAAGITFEVVA